jgi:polar amino acid transport system substrate-binding protein
MPEIDMPENPEYHLRVGTTGILKPFSYYDGTELTGHDIELAYRFAAWLNADVEFKIYDFGGVIAACDTGDVDCVMTNLYITPERAEAIDFSDPLSETPVGYMVRDASAGHDSSFLSRMRSGFDKTFIRNSRWKLFVQGIWTTLLITVSAILLGTLLGFVVYMICRKGSRIANTATRFCVWLVQGMPVVVLLMILYYIVFGSVEISGTLVAIIGFTLLFGAAVYSMLKTGVATVDYGQTEAAYSLGYTDTAAFYRIVLPQAIPVIMPGYMTEISALLKATAVVGYIAVQDLTKMGDIVRSRTYEAFFPLIAVAVIYFILAAILTYFVNRIELRTDPKRRTLDEIKKAVERD